MASICFWWERQHELLGGIIEGLANTSYKKLPVRFRLVSVRNHRIGSDKDTANEVTKSCLECKDLIGQVYRGYDVGWQTQIGRCQLVGITGDVHEYLTSSSIPKDTKYRKYQKFDLVHKQRLPTPNTISNSKGQLFSAMSEKIYAIVMLHPTPGKEARVCTSLFTSRLYTTFAFYL